MIDFRHETFLLLCKIRNYTKTAEVLHMTQPAVTQHIQYLEQIYGGKLFTYINKRLMLTEKGEKLFDYTSRIVADTQQIKDIVIYADKEIIVSFGATLTIGEYVMPQILSRVIQKDNLHFNMLVENTKLLIEKLHDGKISFALLEGFFDKSKFGYKLIRKEEFIGLCSKKSKLNNGEWSLEDLLKYRIVLREKGSGTRDILEQVLYENNLSINSFQNVIEIGNMNAIKELVSQNYGITFMYKAAALKEIEKGDLCKIEIIDFNILREFNFVYLKNSIHEHELLEWYNLFKSK